MTNYDINFQDELGLLSYEINAAEAFLSTLRDKAEYFEKLCEDTAAKLHQAQKHCKELQELIEKRN